MKGVIASAVIAAVIVAGSVAYTNHIDKVSRELGEINDRVMAFLYDGDYESAGDEIEKLVQYLDENRTVLAATGNHEDFDKIEMNISELLTGDGMSKESISEDLRNIASEDQLTDTTSISKLDLQHFEVAYLRGKCETDKCLYSYLLAKDGSCGFYLSIIYGNEKEETVEEILKSFKLSE